MLKGFGKGTARQSWRIPVSNLETLSGLQNHFMDKKTKAMKTEATNEPTKTKVEDTEDVYWNIYHKLHFGKLPRFLYYC